MTTGTRLAIGSAIVLGVTAYMTYLGASSSWQYYLTVDECIANASALFHEPIRVSGKIAADSLSVEKDRVEATFSLEGTHSNLCVNCSGQLPDNLAEGRQVVVEGRMQNADHLVGDRVLTRCASKYSSRASSEDSDRVEQGNTE
jgi:cytochrome c-type biogenesis protein CcmE